MYQLENKLDCNKLEEKEMNKLQRDFENFVQLYKEIEKKILIQSINPTIFGVGLNGALIKTFIATIVSIGVAILKFVFF